MAEDCKISIVIPCYNHGEFLPEAVTSVTRLGREDVELIVVDDGSTDERTRKEINTLDGCGVRVIRQENRGLAAARNVGIKASKGKYIFPLDADDHLRDGWIDRAIVILNTNPEVGIVYGDGEYFGIRTGRWRVGPFDSEKLLKWNYIAACALFRRAVWERNSGYDGAMPVQGLEDWDFWLGALEHGWRFEYLPQIMFDYRVAKDSMLTRTAGFETQIEKFVSVKHALLYRRAWLQLDSEHRSLKATARNLGRLVRSRLGRTLQK